MKYNQQYKIAFWITPLFVLAIGFLVGTVAFTNTRGASAATSTPQIANVQVTDITDTAATITWDTDAVGNSVVEYGISTPFASGATSTALVTSHALLLTALAPNTTYLFDLHSTNELGTTDGPGNGSESFVTASSSGTSAPTPVVSGVAITNVASSTVSVSWTTDRLATSQLFYGLSTAYGSSTELDSGLVTAHSVTISDLLSQTLYHFLVRSTSTGGVVNSNDQTFTTQGAGNGNVGGTVTPSDTTASTTSLGLSSIDMVKGAATPDGTYANGWEWIFHFTVPIDETQFALKFSDFAGTSTTIATANDIRYYSAESDNASSAGTAVLINAAGTYPSTMLNLTGDTNLGTPGRQIDVVVQMKVPVGTAGGAYGSFWNAESNPTATTTP